MTNKFTRLKERFAQMYNDGSTYREISKELGINVLTALGWRKKLNLPPRRQRGPLSWMDEKKIQGKSPREILERIAAPLGLSTKDIQFILVRFEKLKSKGVVRGRRQIHLILTAAYLYLRWERSGRQPLSPKSFVAACKDKGLQVDRRTLLMYSRLFKDAGLYPWSHLKPNELLERMWNTLKAEYGLPENVKVIALGLMSRFNFTGRSPEVVVAACLYVGARKCSMRITQKDLAERFGITEVSVRNVKNLLDSTSYREDPIESRTDEPTEASGVLKQDSSQSAQNTAVTRCDGNAIGRATTDEPFKELREAYLRSCK
jgi:transcription initiation factor TFIIIB Brf1 subunit/transcription initiation factor TFIIB